MMEEPQRVPPRMAPIVQEIVHRLVIGDYAGLEKDGPAQTITGEYLENAVKESGVVLADIPTGAFSSESVAAFPRGQGRWYIDVPLWLKSGDTQLTLQIFLQETAQGIKAEIEELHVM